jgi:hypothetical protein
VEAVGAMAEFSTEPVATALSRIFPKASIWRFCCEAWAMLRTVVSRVEPAVTPFRVTAPEVET